MIPKFRAWDKVKRSIILVSEIVYSSDLSYINRVTLDGRDHKMLYGAETRHEDDVVLMQSTGLHDKQGVEIFEGDVVKFRDKLYQIEFNSYRFKAKYFWLNYQDVPDDFFSEGAYKQCEVIGNVHQSPELLGDRK